MTTTAPTTPRPLTPAALARLAWIAAQYGCAAEVCEGRLVFTSPTTGEHSIMDTSDAARVEAHFRGFLARQPVLRALGAWDGGTCGWDGCDEASRPYGLAGFDGYADACALHAADAMFDAVSNVAEVALADAAEDAQNRAEVDAGLVAFAKQAWTEAKEWWRPCCSGAHAHPTTKRESSFYLHPKRWEASGDYVSVEYGVEFTQEGAQLYFLRDFDSVADSEPFGDLIPYPEDGTLPDAFFEAIEALGEKVLDFTGDLMSCEHCGYHYYGEPCCTGSDDAEEVMS
jgi:hypothetical protein